jgi:hypothetical protein
VNALQKMQTMTSDSFFSATQKSVAGKVAPTRLNNVSVADFSVPSDNNDAFTGPKPLIDLHSQPQAPAVPKRLPEARTKDQL